jgi:hypothetical protein
VVARVSGWRRKGVKRAGGEREIKRLREG